MGILSEIFLLILILSIFVLFWNYYSKNTFLVGLLAVRDAEVRHTCASLLFPLVSDEYIRSVETGGLVPITYFREEFLGIEELITYPTPEKLLDEIRFYYKGSGILVDVKVYNGTKWLELEPTRQEQFFELLLGTEVPTGGCSMPLFSIVPDYAGKVNMSVRI